MDLVNLTEELVKAVALHKESVSVKEFETENENEMLIEVMIDKDDMGRVIGKNGRTANAIRTLVQASSFLEDNKYIKINIESF